MSLKSILKVANYYSVKYGFDKMIKKTASSIHNVNVTKWSTENYYLGAYSLYGEITCSLSSDEEFDRCSFTIEYMPDDRRKKFESKDELRSELAKFAKIQYKEPLSLSRIGVLRELSQNMPEIIMMISDEDLERGMAEANKASLQARINHIELSRLSR